ncbi:uncharacterized protein TNCV_3324841 [Trichonephila clavipes]|nr:uncharacterized protein TNCV_3324841 [Trichonephila clavipes]
MTKHTPVHDGILIDFQVIHNERICALAEPISGQTQDNSHTKLAFVKPSALSYTPNDVVGIIFRLAAATPFVAVNRSLSLLQTHIFSTLQTGEEQTTFSSEDINSSGEIIKSILARTETDPVFNDWFPFAFNSRDCDELNTIQESAAETSGPTFSGVGGIKTTKDESIQTAFASKDETDSLKQTPQPPKQVSETETNTNPQTENTLQTHLTENVQNFTHADQAVSHETESTKNQNAAPAPNNEISKSVEETNGVNHSTEVSTANTAPRDVLDSCMSLIRPDGDEQLQDYMFESTDNVPDNANNIQSSTPVSISVIENKTMPTDTSALKPVSIGTPFQVETQMALTQSALNQNTIPTISGNSPMPISPAVQNTHICPAFNSSMPTTTLLQLPYSPMSTIVLPSSAMQSSVQYSFVLPSVNWACNHATNEIIMPVQSQVNSNVVRAADVNSSPIKIPADFSPTKALNLKDNVANFITVTSENAPSKKKKKKHNFKSIIHISPSPDSFANKKRKKIKPPRKKRRNLFSSPENPTDTDSEIVDDIPVLSIPDPSPNKNESLSAMEILSNIVENKNTQSPLLKAMISSAKILAEKGGRLNSTHVRALEFSSSVENDQETLTSKQLKTLSKSDGVRSSPRLKQKKVCNSPSCSPSNSPKNVDSMKKGNKSAPNEKSNVTVDLVESTIKQLNTCKSVPSSMSDVVLSAMQEALQSKSVNSKKQNSSDTNDVLNIAETNTDPQEFPVSKMSSNSPNIKGRISREQYFPDSSDSDSDSDNLPICVLAASMCASKSKAKEAELNSPGKSTKKSILEAEGGKKHTTLKSAEKKSLEKMSPSTKLSSKSAPLQNNISGMSECSSTPLKTKDSRSQKQKTEDGANRTSELPASSMNPIEKCSSDKKDFSSDSSGKTSSKNESVGSNTDKCSNRREKAKPICSQKSPSKFDKNMKNRNERKSIMGLSDREGNSPFPLIVLDSDEEVDISTETDRSSIVKTESEDLNWSPKIQKTKQRKKSRKSKVGSRVKKKRSSTKNSSREIEKNSNLSEKLDETTIVYELGDNHRLNKEADLPLSTTSVYGSQSSPNRKKVKNSQSKPSHVVSSPVKESDVKSQKSIEKAKVSNKSRISKKTKSIDELCDKLLQNASQSSPHKKGSSHSLVNTQQVQLLKLPADNVVNKVNEKPSEKHTIEEMENTIPVLGNKTFSESEIALQENNSKIVDGNNELVINSEPKTNAEIDSGTKIISKESSNVNQSISNVKKRVIPPPKKRIRPVPVLSPCDQSFSPFSPFSSPAHSACLDFSLKSKEVPSLSTDPSNSEKRNADILPEPKVTKSPMKIEVNRKCLSGKPKSMAEFYKNALPNRDGELPISPDPISSSSCTIDTFLARREMGILSESPPNKETNLVSETSFAKEAKIIAQKRKLSLNENQSSDEEGLIKSPEVLKAVEKPTDGILIESSPIKRTRSTRKRKRAINENQSSDEECFVKSTRKGTCSSKKKKLSLNENESSEEEGLVKFPPKISTTMESLLHNEPDKECFAKSPKKGIRSSKKKKLSLNGNESSDEEGLIKSSPKISTAMKSPMLHNEPDEECFVKSPKKGICSSKKKMLSLKENESSDEEGLIKSPPKISTTMKSPMLHNEPDEECFVKSPKKGICSSKKKMLSLKENESSDEEGLIKSPPKISTTMKNPTLPNPSPAQDQINAHVSSDEEGLIISPVKNHNLEHNKVPALSHIRKKQKVENVSNPNNQISYSIETKVQKCRNSDHVLKNVDIVTEKSTHAQISYFNRPPPLYKIRQKSKLKEMSNPNIPAGVKFPSKWSNSTIYNYSTAIKTTTSEIDDKKESDGVNSSKGPRRSRPSIKVAFKSPAKRNSHVKKSFPKERQSYSRYEVKPNPPFRTLYSARAARRYNLGPRVSPPRNSPYNLSRSTIDCHRVESKQTIPDNYTYKETEKSFLRETTSKVYEGSRYTHGYNSNKDNVLTRNDSEAFDKSSNLNNRSDKVSDYRLNKSQISLPSETSFNEDFHSTQNIDENVSKNVNVSNEKNQECEGQISETNIHLISETNKETLSHVKYMKDDNPQNPDFSVITMPDKYLSSFRKTERGNKFDKQRFPCGNPSVNNTEKSKDRESLNKDKFQEPNTGMLTMPDNVTSSFKRAEDKNRNQKQNPPCNKSDVFKTEESRKETFVNQDNVHNPGSYVLTMPDNIPSSFRIADKNRNQKRDSPSDRSNVNKTVESRKEKFVNQDSIHKTDSCLLTVPDNVPSSFRRAEDKNENQKHKPPCDKSDVSKTEESKKGTFVNQAKAHIPGSYVLTMPDNIPSSFRIADKNRNQKRDSPSDRSNVNKTVESRKEKFVNQDSIHKTDSCLLTVPDNVPSSFRRAEDKNENQKHKPPCDKSDVSKTEESKKEHL